MSVRTSFSSMHLKNKTNFSTLHFIWRAIAYATATHYNLLKTVLQEPSGKSGISWALWCKFDELTFHLPGCKLVWSFCPKLLFIKIMANLLVCKLCTFKVGLSWYSIHFYWINWYSWSYWRANLQKLHMELGIKCPLKYL